MRLRNLVPILALGGSVALHTRPDLGVKDEAPDSTRELLQNRGNVLAQVQKALVAEGYTCRRTGEGSLNCSEGGRFVAYKKGEKELTLEAGTALYDFDLSGGELSDDSWVITESARLGAEHLRFGAQEMNETPKFSSVEQPPIITPNYSDQDAEAIIEALNPSHGR